MFTKLAELIRPNPVFGNVAFSLAASGPIRSYCQFLKRKYSGMGTNTNLAKVMMKNGITITYHGESKVITPNTIDKECEEFWKKYQETITSTIKGIRDFFGTLMQIAHYSTNFEYNFNCIRIMESSVRPSNDKAAYTARRSISQIGLDNQLHAPLARGFGKPEIIMSSDPLGLGFATVVIKTETL